MGPLLLRQPLAAQPLGEGINPKLAIGMDLTLLSPSQLHGCDEGHPFHANVRRVAWLAAQRYGLALLNNGIAARARVGAGTTISIEDAWSGCHASYRGPRAGTPSNLMADTTWCHCYSVRQTSPGAAPRSNACHHHARLRSECTFGLDNS